MSESKTPTDREIVAVIGLGPLGCGIAACCLAHGFDVIGIDREQKNRERLVEYLPEAAAQCVQAGLVSTEDAVDFGQHTLVTEDMMPAQRACLVIEAITEHLLSKKQLLIELESVLDAHVPIGSNTSAFPITALQEDCQHPQRIFGMHWSSHGHLTRFMELTPGEQTSAETMAFAATMAGRLGKEPAILRKDVPGFLCNRIAYAMYREAVYLLESGVADADTIDRSFRNSIGLWAAMCGPLRVIDLMGGGAFYGNCINGVLPTLANSTELAPTLQSFIDQGAKGPKNNLGFYQYDQGDEAEWAQRFTAAVLAIKDYQDRYIPRDVPDSIEINSDCGSPGPTS